MQAIKNLGNIALVIGMSAAFVILIGWLVRAYQILFCMGYGC